MKKYLVVGVILIGGYLYFTKMSEVSRLKEELREVKVRLAEAKENVEVRFIHDSIPVYQTKVVEVDKTDYKKQLADKELIKALNLRVAQLESEQQTNLVTKDTVFLTAAREGDSIVTYRDKWTFFSYCLDTGELDWEVRDSLSTYVAREYKHRFLWWRWGTKGYNVILVSHNPKCRIDYNKFIKIE